jgi:hypothetical protein
LDLFNADAWVGGIGAQLHFVVVTQPPSCSVEPEGMKMYGVWVYPMGILIHFIFFKTAGDVR